MATRKRHMSVRSSGIPKRKTAARASSRRVPEELARVRQQLDARTRELSEALEQQTATAEILRVISNSPTDIQPVLDAVAESAARLCGAYDVLIRRVEGNVARVVAHFGAVPFNQEAIPIKRGSFAGRSILDRRTIHIKDAQAPHVREEYPDVTMFWAPGAPRLRTILVAPLLREDTAIGTIVMRRREVRPFSDQQIALLQTFAAQAVIAIENVRLFNETKEALEQQTVISEILGVISSSPAEVQPVFDAIVKSGVHLFGGLNVSLLLVKGDQVERVASTIPFDAADNLRFPLNDDRFISPRAISRREVVQVPDLFADSQAAEATKRRAEREGFRSLLCAPMLREDNAIGAITVSRSTSGPFTDKQIALLKTFAAQAVIAIENVRLFKELQTRNAEITEALEQQTATAEILKVISGSPTDLQPVFDTILGNAMRLCEADRGMLRVFEGDSSRMVAEQGVPAAFSDLRKKGLLPAGPNSALGQLIAEKRVIHIADLSKWSGYAKRDPLTVASVELGGTRTYLAVPMLKEGSLVGAITILRHEVRPFTDKQIALLQTFADQAVIAIENVRLFNETKEALERQTATSEVLRVISSSPTNLQPVFEAILERGTQLCEAHLGLLGLYDGEKYQTVAHRGANADYANYVISRGRFEPHPGMALGRMIAEGQPVQIPDIRESPAYRDRDPNVVAIAELGGARTFLAVPMLKEGRVVGGISIYRPEVRPFTQKQIDLVSTFASQAVIAIENVRLFNEIQDKSRQLEVASRHKSDFLAHMSHELRTPLNAIIGFSEALLARMFGEVNVKQDEYLHDIHSSGQHLLSLINDILDLAKVEAGRMELELSEFDLPTALQNAMTLVRERAQTHGIALELRVDEKLGQIRADERKVKQIVLNLLSNAVKFTPDGGRVEVDAHLNDALAEISVKDTGAGIAPEDQAALFEEFRQVGHHAAGKQEGTGLGLALTRRFVELHGGKIWLESAPGKGSTFTFTLPLSRPN